MRKNARMRGWIYIGREYEKECLDERIVIVREYGEDCKNERMVISRSMYEYEEGS